MSRHNPRTILGVFLILAFTTFTLAGSAFAQTESTLYNFTGGSDGGAPYGGRLIFDPSGNLYGIAIFGGINDNGVTTNYRPLRAEVGRKRFCTASSAAATDRTPRVR